MTHFKFDQENCPGGCPCDDYECEDIIPTVKDAVLLLNTGYSSNVPMVITYNGKLHLMIT